MRDPGLGAGHPSSRHRRGRHGRASPPGPSRRRPRTGSTRRAVSPPSMSGSHRSCWSPAPKVASGQHDITWTLTPTPDAGPDAADLLQRLQVDLVGQPAAAPLLRVGHRQQPELAQHAEDITGEGAVGLGTRRPAARVLRAPLHALAGRSPRPPGRALSVQPACARAVMRPTGRPARLVGAFGGDQRRGRTPAAS